MMPRCLRREYLPRAGTMARQFFRCALGIALAPEKPLELCHIIHWVVAFDDAGCCAAKAVSFYDYRIARADIQGCKVNYFAPLADSEFFADGVSLGLEVLEFSELFCVVHIHSY